IPELNRGALDPDVSVAVDDGDDQARSPGDLHRGRLAPRGGHRRPTERLLRVVRPAACSGEPYKQNHDPYGSAIGSGTSSAKGPNVPPSRADSTSSEKKRDMYRPARKSPSRGSGRSPAASASASSG